MQRQSVEALDLLTTSDEIVSSIETHGVEVATKLEERWQVVPTLSSTPQVEGPERPNFQGQLFALKDGLVASATTVSEADQLHVHQLGNLIQLREDRNNVRDEAYGKFSTMRRAVDELQGPGKAFVLAGIEGPTARKAPKLLRQIDLAVPRLLHPDLEMPDPDVAGIHLDPKAMGRQLQEVADRLRKAQADFRRAIRIVQASRRQKNRRIADHKEFQLWSARIVEGYYRLAGETELADRLRPATVRVGRPTPPGDSPDEPDDGIPDNGTVGEPVADSGEEPTLDASASD